TNISSRETHNSSCGYLFRLLHSFLQWRCRRQLQIKQRIFIVEERLVVTRQRFPSSTDRIQQIEHRSFARLERKIGEVLDLVDLGQHPGTIELDTALLTLKRGVRLFDIAQNDVRKNFLIVLRFLLLYQRFYSLTLIPIEDRQRKTNSKAVRVVDKNSLETESD